ncbi:MAG: hypothetical protein O9301_05000 [Leptospira sp.]|nr:hypothetical protein [Leptospira sp.]
MSVVLSVHCRRKKKDDIDPQLLSVILSQASSIESACQRFILSEAACVATPDSGIVVCPNLISSLKSKILPTTKATDSVAVLYFNCFTEANILYNSAKGCGKSSFNTNVLYRDTQRAGTADAEVAWREAFDRCSSRNNRFPDPGTDLAKSETTLSGDPIR